MLNGSWIHTRTGVGQWIGVMRVSENARDWICGALIYANRTYLCCHWHAWIVELMYCSVYSLEPRSNVKQQKSSWKGPISCTRTWKELTSTRHTWKEPSLN